MKKAIILSLLVALVVFAAGACQDAATGTLRVKVQGADAGALSGAKVVSSSQPENQLKVTGLTGGDGFVTFTAIKTGQYEFTVSRAGYVQQDFSVKVASGNREVTVTMEPQ
jgi:hypothetical protein